MTADRYPPPRRHSTVAELVEKLRTYPPETPVAVRVEWDRTYWNPVPTTRVL